MKNVFAIIGVAVVMLGAAGELGVGNFRLYYVEDATGCTKMESSKKDSTTLQERNKR